MTAATTWVCSPHGTRVEQEESPTFDCPEADRAGCYWTKVESAATTAVQWECQVGAADEEGSLTIFDVTITTPDVREAIRRCCEDYPSEDIEWVRVRRV